MTATPPSAIEGPESSSSSSTNLPSDQYGNSSNIVEMGRQSSNSDVEPSKAGGSTVKTCVESSEEFTSSAELSPAGTSEEVIRLSGLSIVDNAGDSQQQQASDQEQQQQQSGNSPKRLSPTAEGKSVHFPEDLINYITEEDVLFIPTLTKKQKKQRKKEEEKAAASAELMNDASTATVTDEDIWWSPEELEVNELNAMYMVKECQQYQEEVVCTVLYNKAFLTAANLAKTITEDELEARLEDIGGHTQNLESWTAVGQSRRGLESMVSEKGVVDATQCRKDVLNYQQELREDASFRLAVVEDNSAATECADASSSSAEPVVPAKSAVIVLSSEQTDALAQRCQDSSRTARIMARMMGQADHDSLVKADEEASQDNRLPEPPGTHDNYDYQRPERVSRADRRGQRSSLIKPLKKAVGSVFRRQGSQEVHKRRILRMQQKKMEEDGPEKRQSQEFRRSFIEGLEYGEGAPGKAEKHEREQQGNKS